jgi:hypothetical protein
MHAHLFGHCWGDLRVAQGALPSFRLPCHSDNMMLCVLLYCVSYRCLSGCQAPLVYFFGDVSPDKQADLYKVSLLCHHHWIA